MRLRRSIVSGAPGVGENLLTGITFVVSSLMISSLAIDLGSYFAVQTQLQTAVDSAALAGAVDLPYGKDQADDAALEYAQKNFVNGGYLEEGDLQTEVTDQSYKVLGKTTFEPTLAKMFCGGGVSGYQSPNGTSQNTTTPCEIDVYASSTAKPAARDTILVIDTSSSMKDLGNMQPLRDVQTAAKKYIDMIAEFNNESVDRIGVVSFDQTGALEIGLTSQAQSSAFATVKSKVDSLILFGCGNTSCTTSASGQSGWNTNYQQGLQYAINELRDHGRPNAEKIIIFLTDGRPNLPAPTNYYTSTSDKSPYNRCLTPVNNGAETRETICNYTTVSGKRVYSNCMVRPTPYSHSTSSLYTNTYYTVTVPSGKEAVCTMKVKYSNIANRTVSGKQFSNCSTLPDDVIPDTMLVKYQNNERPNCGQTYVDYMIAQTKAEADRAIPEDITIHTISIWNDTASTSWPTLRRLVYDPDWDPGLTSYMASMTGGQEYDKNVYDAQAMQDTYEIIAKDVHVILSEEE